MAPIFQYTRAQIIFFLFLTFIDKKEMVKQKENILLFFPLFHKKRNQSSTISSYVQ